MTLTIELTPDLARRVETAKARGVDVDAHILSALETLPSEATTIGAQIVAAWERDGIIGSRPDIADSQSHARDIRERAQRRESE